MGRVIVFRACLFGLLLTTATSRSDSGAPSLPSGADTEPITGTPAESAPGSESVRHDPFTPYDVGDPAGTWSYAQLTAGEKAYVDAGKDTTAWVSVHNAFGAAVAEQAQTAAATSAENQLGITNLQSLGVVP